MVKEIEQKNTTELLESGLQLDFETYPEIISAVLSLNGMLMTVKVNRYLARGSVRKVALYYMLPNYEQQVVAEYELLTYAPSDTVTEATEYTFALDAVMNSIIHTMPEQLYDQSMSVRLYTYEANTSFNYGTCYPNYSAIVAYVVGDYVQYGGRLWQCKLASVGNLPTDTKYWTATGVPSSGTIQFNVPYTLSYPSNQTQPPSTDGWYTLRVLDNDIYDNAMTYVVGDIVWYVDGLFVCIADTQGNLPSDTVYWEPMSTEQERNLYEFGHEPTPTISTLLNCNMLITRYIKQKYIYELFIKSNYKRYDDIKVVTQLEKIFSMREAAVVYLATGNPIQARYMLDLITNEMNTYTKNVGEQRVIETITNFTI